MKQQMNIKTIKGNNNNSSKYQFEQYKRKNKCMEGIYLSWQNDTGLTKFDFQSPEVRATHRRSLHHRYFRKIFQQIPFPKKMHLFRVKPKPNPIRYCQLIFKVETIWKVKRKRTSHCALNPLRIWDEKSANSIVWPTFLRILNFLRSPYVWDHYN